jgi:hypothetical protein
MRSGGKYKMRSGGKLQNEVGRKIQNEVGRKRDVGSGTRPVQTNYFKNYFKN